MTHLNQSTYPPGTHRVCQLSGVNRRLLQNDLLSLRDHEKLMEQIIRDAQTALSDHEKWAALEMGARATLMVCDILIVGLEAMTGGAGAAVSKLYDGSKMVADAAMSGNLDPKTGYVMLAKNKAKVTELAAGGMGKPGVAKALDLAQQLVGYGEAMWGFVSGASTMQGDGASGIRAGIATASNQLRRIQYKIREIEAALRACEPDDAVAPLLA